jgi:hypothetical protein
LEVLADADARTRSVFEFSLCLSRACVGKQINFIHKWLKNDRFSHLMMEGVASSAVFWSPHNEYFRHDCQLALCLPVPGLSWRMKQLHWRESEVKTVDNYRELMIN